VAPAYHSGTLQSMDDRRHRQERGHAGAEQASRGPGAADAPRQPAPALAGGPKSVQPLPDRRFAQMPPIPAPVAAALGRAPALLSAEIRTAHAEHAASLALARLRRLRGAEVDLTECEAGVEATAPRWRVPAAAAAGRLRLQYGRESAERWAGAGAALHARRGSTPSLLPGTCNRWKGGRLAVAWTMVRPGDALDADTAPPQPPAAIPFFPVDQGEMEQQQIAMMQAGKGRDCPAEYLSMYSETCANMNLEDPLATGFQSGPLPQEPCTSSKDHSPEGSIPVSSDNATRESSSAPEAEPAPKRGARGDKGKPRSGNAENQARYRARCKTKRMGLEGVYQSTKEALEREQRESARLTLDTAVLTGILSVRDMSIKVLEGPQEGPEALNDSPSNPGLNVRSGEGISPRLHAEVKQYLEHVERLFMDLALAEGCSRQCVTSLDLTWDQLVEYGEEVRGMTETQFCAALDSFRDAAREVIAELDGTGSRLCLLQMVGAWQSMACMHSVATACRPDRVMATMAQAQAA
ncbi:hypothetical protein APUTEX25_004770, partial [Auxenochlorella protothecoides]